MTITSESGSSEKSREREKRKLENDKKRRKIYDGDDFDDNDDPIYRDDKGNIIPTFKTKDDGTNNNLLDGALDLNNFWNSWVKKHNPGKILKLLLKQHPNLVLLNLVRRCLM